MFPLTLLSSLFGGGLPTKIMAVVLTAGLLFTGVKCTSVQVELNKANKQIATLSTDNAQLKINNAQLKANVDQAVQANQSTVEANKQLLAERAKAQQAIAALSKTKEKQRVDLAAANKKIDEMLKDPKNNGVVAPVLRETLRDVQKRSK